MAAPKNNLEELMRQRAGGSSAIATPTGPIAAGSSRSFKFKPAGSGGNATLGTSNHSSAPIPEVQGLKKSKSEGPSRIKASALVSAMSRGIPSGSTLASTTPSTAPTRGGKRLSSEHEPSNIGSSPKRPKLGGAQSDSTGKLFLGSENMSLNCHSYCSGNNPFPWRKTPVLPMEGVDEIDPGFLADANDDDDEAIWNEMHAPSSAPAIISVPAPNPISRQGSAGLSKQGRQASSRNPTPVNRSQFPGSGSVPHRLLSSQAPSRAGTPLVAQSPFVPPVPPPPEVPGDLQTMNVLDLQQRLLIPNYKKLIETMSQIIDDPDQDRFILDSTRQLLVTRISGIEAAIAWRSSFEPPANALGLEAGSSTGSLGLNTGVASVNHATPMTPSTPGPSIGGASKRDAKPTAGSLPNAHLLLSSPTISQTPSRERLYPRLPDEGIKSPSPRRPQLAINGARNPISREGSGFNSGKSRATNTPDMEVFDLESDDSDVVEISSTEPPKVPPPPILRSFDSISDANVTKRSPRKLPGIEAMPVPSGSGSNSKTNSSKESSEEPKITNISAAPSANVATTSRHFALAPMDTRQDLFDDLDSELNIPTQVEEEQSTSIYKDEIMDKLKSVFGLESFRTNQAPAVDATMSGQDVFVLMPTGGGKSLCYQLPAVCTTGRTRGVTFVVSPLKSLMIDQVRQLRAKGIDVIMFNSDQSAKAAREARARLVNKGTKPALVYVTPEKLEMSGDMRNILDNLMRQGQLARFVIDEAHCVSTWGRDFREAYQGLGFLRQSYPGIPIMALTATANSKVRQDVIFKLGITGCVELVQSFNRPNLYYEVRKKGKGVVTDIASYIRSHHHEQTGVVYCLSRAKCEEVAKELRERHNITARHYHAAMTAGDKSETQAAWISGECRVIVATIAFGMGIDKPDVRFVIHHQIPMSLSGYYQETGRAGRDGKPAQCILYYNYGDKTSMERMIEQGGKDGKPLSLDEQQRQKDDIRQVVQYCQNKMDCRRSLVLAYFSEQFNPLHCIKTCDNCVNSEGMVNEDMSKVACMALELVDDLAASRPTMIQAIDIFKGSKNKVLREKGWDRTPMFGKGQDHSRETVERIFQHLVTADALREELYQNKMGFSNAFIALGGCAKDYMEGRKKFMLSVGSTETSKGKQIMSTAMSAPNKYQPLATTRHTVTRKSSTTSISKPVKKIRSVNRTEDVDYFDSDGAERSKVASGSRITDDMEDIIDYSVPSNFFDDPDTIETQEEEIPTNGSTEQVATGSAQVLVPDSDIEDDTAGVSGFTAQFRRLKKLRERLAKQLKIEDLDDVLQEEVLQELALLEYNSEAEFKEALRSALGPEVNFNEKFELYGKPFMDLCLKNTAQSTQVKTPKISELHNQYDFKGSPKRPGGFKPAPSRASSRKF
ncbi:unnamed protein product [Rhizoctonia solani]|uniref:DNA 3'-5' helicase n=1 Tax=Rhizoctonia solani TaxID=456999 RepID=A0A8H3DFQ8_9AGAM|nr:unnamed protein product [Rhizoctonia solani]